MTQHDSESTAFSIGDQARVGNISVGGSVAGRDVVTTTTTTTGASSAQDMAQLLEALKQVQEQIAALSAAPAGLREDAQDELRKAQQAAADGDTQRMSEKLSTAQSVLERIGQNLPTALALAKTVATVAASIAGVV